MLTITEQLLYQTQLQFFLETLLFSFIDSYDTADEYQFGLKNHSTSTYAHAFQKTVSHCRQNGSHVFACFIDFNKAFDNVDFWLLFCKLIDNNPNNACYVASCLLTYWYSSQQVRWHNISSNFFEIFNGVRQGGMLSPFLFNFYIRDLISRVTNLNIGCNLWVLMLTCWHMLMTWFYWLHLGMVCKVYCVKYK